MRLEIDVWEWPFLWLEEREKLPRVAGVYVAVCNGQVLYVGQSGNIRARWRAHDKLEELSAYPYIRVGWIEIEASDERDAIEALLWERYNPELNRVRPCPTGKGSSCGIRLTILAILQQRNKSIYWLAKETGLRYATLHRLATKEVEKIDLRVLEKVARALEREPGDLLVMTQDD